MGRLNRHESICVGATSSDSDQRRSGWSPGCGVVCFAVRSATHGGNSCRSKRGRLPTDLRTITSTASGATRAVACGSARAKGRVLTGINCSVSPRRTACPIALSTTCLKRATARIWSATDGGMCRFNPFGSPHVAANPLFIVHSLSGRENANQVNTLAEDGAGAIGARRATGLPAGARGQAGEDSGDRHRPAMRDPAMSLTFPPCSSIARVCCGQARSAGLTSAGPMAESNASPPSTGCLRTFCRLSLRIMTDGSGTRKAGLCLLASSDKPHQPIVERGYSIKDALAGNDVRQVFRSSDGRLWIATVGGLSELAAEGAPPSQSRFVNYTDRKRPEQQCTNLVRDRDGNLWIGTRESGLMRMARAGFTTYGEGSGYRLALKSPSSRIGWQPPPARAQAPRRNRQRLNLVTRVLLEGCGRISRCARLPRPARSTPNA